MGCAEQVPFPSQLRDGWYWFPAHEAVPHIVPGFHLRHCPLPLQVPSWLQVVWSELSHSLSGSVCEVTGWQRPLVWPVLSFEQA
jgi:hypothetical protein